MHNFIFHDGLLNPIKVDKIVEFEAKSILGKYYEFDSLDSSQILEELGPAVIDFSNINDQWTIPDVSKESARLFSIWGEDENTNSVLLIIHGYYILVPFEFSESILRDYYYIREVTPYYPIALIHSIRIINDKDYPLIDILNGAKHALELNWNKTRTRVIDSLDKNSILFHRYVLTLDKLITYIFLVPSIDNTLLHVLKKLGFYTTGVMQLMSNRTEKYDEVTIQNHILEAKKVFKSIEDSKSI